MSKLKKVADSEILQGKVNKIVDDLDTALSSLNDVEQIWTDIELSDNELTKDLIAGSYEANCPFREMLTQLRTFRNNIISRN